VHVGAHFLAAARSLDIKVRLVDASKALSTNRWINSFCYHLAGHQPFHLHRVSRQVREEAENFQPTVLLATGMAPIEAEDLSAIRAMGVQTFNFLTDDPFNPLLASRWFTKALPEYDIVFNPRRANIDELRAAGCKDVRYLPFAYAPEIHFSEKPANQAEFDSFASDLYFVGGADKDRIGYMDLLIREGFRLALYGPFWRRYLRTRSAARGIANAMTVRKGAAAGKVALCLVRRSNRDGHCMRTFELPAMGTCMVVEDTEEHREIFGPEGECVVYFQTAEEMLAAVRGLVADDGARARLAVACHRRICGGKNSYHDRLVEMLRYLKANHATPSETDSPYSLFRASKPLAMP
jgi:spore maturation protein CgeB